MDQTIAAIATAPGAGGIAIVRVSGALAAGIAKQVFKPKAAMQLKPRRMTYGHAITRDGAAIDEAMAVLFRAPHSYTGEDVLEVHCHGGSMPAKRVLEACLAAGARLAQPGEFTKRAFLAGRLDLAQAEAVMRVIGAQSEQAARLAHAQLDGALSRAIAALQDRLLAQIALLEAAIDYPEDDLEEQTALGCARVADELIQELKRMLADSRRAIRISEGVRVAIAGRPNAGKSSLLNRLAGEDRAIVTAVPGTTRDVLTERVNLLGLPLLISDTAGLRDTQDEIERMGVERARKELQQADLILLVWDGTQPLSPEDEAVLAAQDNVLLVCNKADLAAPELPLPQVAPHMVRISALTGEGMEALHETIYHLAVGRGELIEGTLTHARQAEAAEQALEALVDALAAAQQRMPPECLCEDLRRAWKALGLITGESADEALISRIFSDFCLGK